MFDDGPHNLSQTLTDNVRRVVHSHLPLAFRDQHLYDTTRLGQDGAGLDSVAIVELLLACEEATGIPFTADVLANGPLTVGHLVRHAHTHTRATESRGDS